jgi:uncharacterized protein YmfQ (DUF2313 family)
MTIPTYSADQFLAQVKRTAPRGRAWPRGIGTVLHQALSGFMPTAECFGTAAAGIVQDVFPATTYSVLPEWESTLGLPDPCAGENPTLQGRQSQVVARLSDSGGSSISYFVAYAKTLGFDITITQFVPARFGQAKFGTPYYGKEWAFIWQVNCPSLTINVAQFGAARFGDPYRTWGGNVLICELNVRAPAHTRILYTWGAQGDPSFLDQFVLDANTLA